MRKEEEQFRDGSVLEGMTSIRALLHAREAGINDRPIKEILYDTAKAEKLQKDLGYIEAVSQKHGYQVRETNADEIATLSIGETHGGLVALVGERTLPRLTEHKDGIVPNGFYALLDGIEDPYNFGYAIRSLFACGVDGIILDERNWLSSAGVVARASAGASELLPVFRATPEEAVDVFHRCGYRVFAADLRTDLELGKTDMKKPLLLIAGGEKRGISRKVLDLADVRVKIPYASDFHASLSCASAVTMFAYEIMRQSRI